MSIGPQYRKALRRIARGLLKGEILVIPAAQLADEHFEEDTLRLLREMQKKSPRIHFGTYVSSNRALVAMYVVPGGDDPAVVSARVERDVESYAYGQAH